MNFIRFGFVGLEILIMALIISGLVAGTALVSRKDTQYWAKKAREIVEDIVPIEIFSPPEAAVTEQPKNEDQNQNQNQNQEPPKTEQRQNEEEHQQERKEQQQEQRQEQNQNQNSEPPQPEPTPVAVQETIQQKKEERLEIKENKIDEALDTSTKIINTSKTETQTQEIAYEEVHDEKLVNLPKDNQIPDQVVENSDSPPVVNINYQQKNDEGLDAKIPDIEKQGEDKSLPNKQNPYIINISPPIDKPTYNLGINPKNTEISLITVKPTGDLKLDLGGSQKVAPVFNPTAWGKNLTDIANRQEDGATKFVGNVIGSTVTQIVNDTLVFGQLANKYNPTLMDKITETYALADILTLGGISTAVNSSNRLFYQIGMSEKEASSYISNPLLRLGDAANVGMFAVMAGDSAVGNLGAKGATEFVNILQYEGLGVAKSRAESAVVNVVREIQDPATQLAKGMEKQTQDLMAKVLNKIQPATITNPALIYAGGPSSITIKPFSYPAISSEKIIFQLEIEKSLGQVAESLIADNIYSNSTRLWGPVHDKLLENETKTR